MSFAAEIGITKAVLEGDSLTIMNALSSDHPSLATFGLILNDVKFSAENFIQLHYFHVKRECNTLAHCLARHAFDISDFLVWMEDIPPQFSVVLQADLANSI